MFDSLRDEMMRLFRDFLSFDEVSRHLYSTDASLFQIQPHAVAIPRNEDQLQRLVHYAFEHQLPLIARGAGTGVAGESLGEGIIVDLSVHFRSILKIDSETVQVQPGVVYQQLNRELAKTGRRLAPNPASGETCTLGGMLATNASGANAIRHGYLVDHVSALQMLWDDGSVGEINRESTSQDERTRKIGSELSTLLESNRSLIQSHRPRTPFNRLGYRLHDVLHKNHLDLPRLLVGSEGTLGIFLSATLKTIPLPQGRGAVLFVFTQLEAALRASQLIRMAPIVACELMDRRLLSLARSQNDAIARQIPTSAEAILLIEAEAESPDEAKEIILQLIDTIQKRQLPIIVTPAFDTPSIERLWSIREFAVPSLYGMGSGPRPLAFVEDIGVPPDQLPEFVGKLQTLFRKKEVSSSLLIHAATGQIHARPFLNLDDPTDREKLWPLANEVNTLVIESGGTISSQHGTGIARTPWVERQMAPLMSIYREVKAIFDPQNILNPGKIVNLDPSRPAWPLRTLAK